MLIFLNMNVYAIPIMGIIEKMTAYRSRLFKKRTVQNDMHSTKKIKTQSGKIVPPE